jgi:hypothetical protein
MFVPKPMFNMSSVIAAQVLFYAAEFIRNASRQPEYMQPASTGKLSKARENYFVVFC